VQLILHQQNKKSIHEAQQKLVSIDDVISKVLWVERFVEEQGWKVDENIIYRGNTSSMKLEENGKQSSGKETQH
jgi:hypothetical protein